MLSTYMNIQGILICFVIIKLLNCIEKFNSKIGMLFKVISIVQNELINFAVIFLILFQTFVVAFKISFGTHFKEFNT